MDGENPTLTPLEDMMKRLFLTLALVAFIAAPAMADRDLSGSTCEVLSPSFLVPGAVNVIEFLVVNNSPDTEWIADVIFTFPECFEIVGGWYDGSMSNPAASFNFSFAGTVASFMDGDGGYGEIYGLGDTCLFYVEVIPTCACGDYLIHWFLMGDIYGAEPHSVEGDVTIAVCDDVAAQDSSWTSLKSLY